VGNYHGVPSDGGSESNSSGPRRIHIEGHRTYNSRRADLKYEQRVQSPASMRHNEPVEFVRIVSRIARRIELFRFAKGTSHRLKRRGLRLIRHICDPTAPDDIQAPPLFHSRHSILGTTMPALHSMAIGASCLYVTALTVLDVRYRWCQTPRIKHSGILPSMIASQEAALGKAT
jgi:hypothetical protein